MSVLVRVTGFDHIVLITADVATSLRFYTEVLGLEGVRAGTGGKRAKEGLQSADYGKTEL